MANKDRIPDTETAAAIRKLQDEVDEKTVLLRALCENYDPEEIDHHEYIKTEAWRKKRQRVFRRDRFQCVYCGCSKNLEVQHVTLEVHHITYKRLGAEDISDLVTLCNDCHQLIHEERYYLYTTRQFWLFKELLTALEDGNENEDFIRMLTDLRAEILAVNENLKKDIDSMESRFMKCVGGT